MKKIVCAAILLLLFFTCCTSKEIPTTTSTSSTISSTSSTTTFFFPEPTTTSSLPINTPVIDGVNSEGEWSDASVVSLSSIDRLYFKVENEDLYILYEALDKNRFSPESALFFDFDGDGRLNYGYGHRPIFFVVPLFDNKTSFYCGSHSSFKLPVQDCERPYGYALRGLEREYVLGATKVSSEAKIPLGDNFIPAVNGSAYFFLLYGHPTLTCFPESMQCFEEPVFQEFSA